MARRCALDANVRNRGKAMTICSKCGADYAAREGESCMCPTYQRRMERGEYDKVPQEWILVHWDGSQLYCANCKSEYWPGEDCDCAVYRVLRAHGREDSVPRWWHDRVDG
jgi:hypothetical protein